MTMKLYHFLIAKTHQLRSIFKWIMPIKSLQVLAIFVVATTAMVFLYAPDSVQNSISTETSENHATSPTHDKIGSNSPQRDDTITTEIANSQPQPTSEAVPAKKPVAPQAQTTPPPRPVQSFGVSGVTILSASSTGTGGSQVQMGVLFNGSSSGTIAWQVEYTSDGGSSSSIVYNGTGSITFSMGSMPSPQSVIFPVTSYTNDKVRVRVTSPNEVVTAWRDISRPGGVW